MTKKEFSKVIEMEFEKLEKLMDNEIPINPELNESETVKFIANKELLLCHLKTAKDLALKLNSK